MLASFSGLNYVGFSLLLVAVVYGVVLTTWLTDFIQGRTLWFSARWEVVVLQVVFIGAMAYLGFSDSAFAPQSMNLFLISPIMLFALSSDAIANSRRWIVLLPAVMFIWIFCFFVTPNAHPFPREGHFFQVPFAVYAYSFIGILAAAARLYFVRTKDLLHTSLDYPPLRLEILSRGMKRPMAFGIKRKSDAGLGLNVD